MTHQIASIDDYLHETSEIAKKDQSRKVILFFTMALACLSLGFGIISSTELNKTPDNQGDLLVAPVADQQDLKFGKVFLAFDPSELDGVEDLEAFLNGTEESDYETKEQEDVFPEDDWTDDGVRNQIVIKGNYYAGH